MLLFERILLCQAQITRKHIRFSFFCELVKWPNLILKMVPPSFFRLEMLTTGNTGKELRWTSIEVDGWVTWGVIKPAHIQYTPICSQHIRSNVQHHKRVEQDYLFKWPSSRNALSYTRSQLSTGQVCLVKVPLGIAAALRFLPKPALTPPGGGP